MGNAKVNRYTDYMAQAKTYRIELPCGHDFRSHTPVVSDAQPVLAYIAEHPGCSGREIQFGLGLDAKQLRTRIASLVADELVTESKRAGKGGGKAYTVTDADDVETDVVLFCRNCDDYFVMAAGDVVQVAPAKQPGRGYGDNDMVNDYDSAVLRARVLHLVIKRGDDLTTDEIADRCRVNRDLVEEVKAENSLSTADDWDDYGRRADRTDREAEAFARSMAAGTAESLAERLAEVAGTSR